MNKKQLLAEYFTLKQSVESEEFQKHVMKPLFEELDKIQKLKSYKSWEEVLKAQGKEAGLLKLVEILKANETHIKNLKFDLKSDAE